MYVYSEFKQLSSVIVFYLTFHQSLLRSTKTTSEASNRDLGFQLIFRAETSQLC